MPLVANPNNPNTPRVAQSSSSVSSRKLPVGKMTLPDGTIVEDPYYLTNTNYFTAADRDALNNLMDQGGNVVKLDDSLKKTLSSYYGKVPGLEDYMNSIQERRSKSTYNAKYDYWTDSEGITWSGGDTISATAIKNLVNSAYGASGRAQGVPEPSTVQGYSTDLAATNAQIRADQNTRQAEYDSFMKAQALPLDQYQQWLKEKQATIDKANQISRAINDNQDNIINSDVPATRDGSNISQEDNTLDQTINGILNQSTVSQPQSFSYEQTFNQLQQQSGLDGLQNQLADINNQLAQEQYTYQQRMDYAGSKPVALGVISGRQSEVTRQEQEKITFLTNQRAAITDQINTSMNMINTMMKYKQLDYENAKAEYQQQFDNALQLQELAIKQQEKQQSVAFANLKLIQDQISEGTIDYNKLTDDERLQINKLELQAGLPIGFSGDIKGVVKGDEVLFHNTVDDSDGNTYSYMTVKATDGIIRTIKQYLYETPQKKTSGGGGGSGGKSSGGSTAKSTTTPSGAEITTTRWNSFLSEAAKIKTEIDNGDKTSEEAFRYLTTKYPELNDQDIFDITGEIAIASASAGFGESAIPMEDIYTYNIAKNIDNPLWDWF